MLSLKRYSPLCPGCFSYEQIEGVQHYWGATPDKPSLDAAVLAFRKANNLARATIEEVSEDTDRYQCDRLLRDKGDKFMRRFCKDSEKPWVQVAAQVPVKRCSGCGAKV